MKSSKTLLLSVILTTYNRSKSLARSIESILNQTLTNFECIVVNDGSIDDTQQVLDDYVKRDNRIKLLYQKNQGPSVARNAGIRRAKGSYIALMDDDDVSLPQRLEKQWRFLQEHTEYAACTCDYEDRQQDKKLTRFIKNSDTKMAYGMQELLQIPKVPFVLSPMSMFKKAAFVVCGGYRSFFRFKQDLDLTLRFQEKFHIGVVPESLYIYTSWRDNLGANLSSSDLVLGLKYTLACYISTLYRRLHHMDPIYAKWSLDSILAQTSKLPLPLRVNYLRQCSRLLDFPTICSSAELLEIMDIADTLSQGLDRQYKRFKQKVMVRLLQRRRWLDLLAFLRRR